MHDAPLKTQKFFASFFQKRSPFFLSAFLAATFLFVIELLAILERTRGHVLFTLDDPYIHLDVAENLARHLHYGLNAGEVSAPSSSILYPFLLAPLVALGFGQGSALILCACATGASIWLVCEILSEAGYALNAVRPVHVVLLAAVLVADTNLVGVAFTGMEHSLQIMTSLGCVFGTQRFLRTGQASWPWLACAALAPSLRYETASFWLGTVCVLAWHKRFRAAAGVMAAGLAPVLAFSAFLWSQGLAPLPSSVLAKLVTTGAATRVHANWIDEHIVLPDLKGLAAGALLMLLAGWRRVGAVLAVATLVCLAVAIVLAEYGLPQFAALPDPNVSLAQLKSIVFGRLLDPGLAEGFVQLGLVGAALAASLPGVWRAGDGRRDLALLGLFVIVAHLAVGQMGWFCRYQAYALISGVVTLAAVRRQEISAFFERAGVLRRGCAVAGASCVCFPFVWCTLHVPDAAADIYGQQFQMHRFVADFYHAPVAVNDIGLVRYENPNYVLDLWGLACQPARLARLAGGGPGWMDDLARRHGVGLAMIYPVWFTAVPANWMKVATLRTHAPPYTVAETAVAFYATTGESTVKVREALAAFSASLPAGDHVELH